MEIKLERQDCFEKWAQDKELKKRIREGDGWIFGEEDDAIVAREILNCPFRKMEVMPINLYIFGTDEGYRMVCTHPCAKSGDQNIDYRVFCKPFNTKSWLNGGNLKLPLVESIRYELARFAGWLHLGGYHKKEIFMEDK